MSAGFRQGPSRSMILVIVTSPICNCRIVPLLSKFQTIEPRCGAAEQISLLRRACTFCHDLAGVPERLVAVGPLVDREVAFEHAARRAERLDAGLDIGFPRRGQFLR